MTVSGNSSLRQRRMAKRKIDKAGTDDDESINEKETTPAVVSSDATTRSTWSSAVRSIALWRMALFCIMLYEWKAEQVLTPFGSLQLELDVSQSKPGKDRWFSYNQFEWIQDLHSVLGDYVIGLHYIGFLLCFLAAFGKELNIPFWRLSTSLFCILYLIRFLAKTTNFTNHNYLFPLLMVLTILSGGGHYSGKEASRRACEAASVALRAQFAVIYGFASLWKLHEDWLTGRIVKGIFESFEARGTSRGIAWSSVERTFPPVYVVLAWSGLFLDAGMFFVLLLAWPRPEATHKFLTFTLLFHVFTTITMGQVIGYSFPATCMAGLFVFLPFQQGDDQYDYDRSVLNWLGLYWKPGISTRKMKHDRATKNLPRPWQQRVVVGWILWQLLFPLRLIVLSGGESPFNRLGYRYSWTMMSHSIDHGIIRRSSALGQPDTVLLLSYVVPTCFRENSPDAFLPRGAYMPNTDHLMQDSRSVPMHLILDNRESAMLNVFPIHLLSRVAAGLGRVVDKFVPNACGQVGVPEQARIGMHWVYFARLNQYGPYSRLVDPTVDLVETVEAQERLGALQTMWNSLMDQRPSGHEFLLWGVGTLRFRAIQLMPGIQQRFPGGEIRFVADRAACLQRRPLWLRPMGNQWIVMPVILPAGMQLSIRWMDMDKKDDAQEEQWKQSVLPPNQPELVQTFAMEIGLEGPTVSEKCGDAIKEDVLFAFVFLEEPGTVGFSVSLDGGIQTSYVGF